MRLMVGVTFVIALLALALHLRPLVVVAPGRAVAPPSQDALGARLQQECESIIDKADALTSPLWFNNNDIIKVLAKNPKVRPELGNAYYDKWEKYRDGHPNEWEAAYREVIQAKQAEYVRDGRPKKIAECMIQRGVKEGR